VRSQATIQVPNHLTNHPSLLLESQKYLYPHSYSNHFIKQNYTQNPIPKFYVPTQEGKEEGLKKRLEKLWGEF
jgi:putative ATPase